MAITTLRSDLLETTSNILNLFNTRREIVAKIQLVKRELNLGAFDVVREKALFNNLKNTLANFSIKELFALSLLMESQAGDDYPAWSLGVHLNQDSLTTLDLVYQINPVLLLILRPASFKMLDLKNEFKEMIDEG